MEKPLPLHGQSFSVIREDGLYYVDKTELIERITRVRQGIYLITRPRRFERP